MPSLQCCMETIAGMHPVAFNRSYSGKFSPILLVILSGENLTSKTCVEQMRDTFFDNTFYNHYSISVDTHCLAAVGSPSHLARPPCVRVWLHDSPTMVAF